VIFKMSEQQTSEKVMNRGLVVLGAVIIQLALGTLYSWGTLTKFVTPYLNSFLPAEQALQRSDTVYIFGVGLLSFAIVMIFAGTIQTKIGPQKTAMLGGIILGIGIIISAFMTTLLGMIITYGIIFGAGIGLAYVVPIATAQKWFPDKVGLITGIAVAGFGAGAFIFNYVIQALAELGIPALFIILGIILLALVILGSLVMKVPPAGWKPQGWVPPAPKAGVTASVDFTRNEILKTPSFYVLWIMYTLSALAGLMVIGAYSAFAAAKNTTTQELLYPAISIVDVVLLGGIGALFNGIGRIIWGKIADMVTYRKALTYMLIMQSVLMYIYYFTNINYPFYFVVTCLIIFCFGGNLSLFPTATKDLFGAKNFSSNYGAVFTAYGIAGFLGATMVQTFVNLFGGYMQLFIVVGVLSTISLALSFILKAPEKR